ncbi:TRDC protein, partial [Rhinopomastus cyanomelas]|nr:TRDC protein [Rhinopomastus cyanomelas]
LKSKEPKQHDHKLTTACLARAFYPKNITLDLPKGDIVYDLKAPPVTSEGMYSTMKVVRVEPDAEVTCEVVHMGSQTTTSIVLPVEKTDESGAVDACSVTAASAKGVKVEKVNMLFVTVLGLRVLLTKSIALGTVMSIKLFLF